MNRLGIITLAVGLVSVVAIAGSKDKPKASVTYAKSWEAAVAEAKMLNIPIVVHSHGFN
ncbi:MAG: hypothetical protein AAGD14_15265 [Planctomycetota bacterium]